LTAIRAVEILADMATPSQTVGSAAWARPSRTRRDCDDAAGRALIARF